MKKYNKIIICTLIFSLLLYQISFGRLIGENNNINSWVGKINNKLDSIADMFVDSVVNDTLEDEKYKGLTADEVIHLKRIDAIISTLSIANIGDIVKFGKATISDLNNKEYIDWIVLDKKYDKMLIMSKYILDNVKYNKYNFKVAWDESSIREYLNNDFYTSSFDVDEKKIIVTSTISNAKNKRYGTRGCVDTYDNVFLLDFDEITKYIEDKPYSKAYGTKYAINNNLWVANYDFCKGSSVWWLRTSGEKENYASYANCTGTISAKGDPVNTDGNGIRPCIWVRIK